MAKRTVILITALFVAGILFVSGCRHHGCGFSSPEKRAEKAVAKLADELELEDSQVAILNTIKDRCLERRADVIDDHKKLGDELIAQVTLEELDVEYIKERLKENISSKEEMVNELILELAEFHKTLNETQKAQLSEFMMEMRARHMKYFK